MFIQKDDTRKIVDLFTVCQICVLVAVAMLEEVAWYLQICNSCFYQMSESWPMGLLFTIEHAYFIRQERDAKEIARWRKRHSILISVINRRN